MSDLKFWSSTPSHYFSLFLSREGPASGETHTLPWGTPKFAKVTYMRTFNWACSTHPWTASGPLWEAFQRVDFEKIPLARGRCARATLALPLPARGWLFSGLPLVLDSLLFWTGWKLTSWRFSKYTFCKKIYFIKYKKVYFIKYKKIYFIKFMKAHIFYPPPFRILKV